MSVHDIAVSHSLWGLDISHKDRTPHQIIRVNGQNSNSRSSVDITALEADKSGAGERLDAEELDVTQLGAGEMLVIIVGELVHRLPTGFLVVSGSRTFDASKHTTYTQPMATSLIVSKLSDKKTNLFALADKKDGLCSILPLQQKMDQNIAWYSEWWDGVSDLVAKKRKTAIRANIANFKNTQDKSYEQTSPVFKLELDEDLVADAERDKGTALYNATEDPVFREMAGLGEDTDEEAEFLVDAPRLVRPELVAVLEAENKARSAIIAALNTQMEADRRCFPGGIPVKNTGNNLTPEHMVKRLMDGIASGDKDEAEDACRDVAQLLFNRAFSIVEATKECLEAHTRQDNFIIQHLVEETVGASRT